MAELIGKTVAWSSDSDIRFTDGTGLVLGEYGWDALSYEEVQGRNRDQRGYREAARMRRLESMLHPRDKQWLAQQRRKARPLARSTVAEFNAMLKDAYKDFNRQVFGGPSLLFAPPRRRRKRRLLRG